LNPRLYHYVGPEQIRRRAIGQCVRTRIGQPEDALKWIVSAEPIAGRRSFVPATYIVDPQTQLWVADRRSEHVACAGAGDVLAAGELVFAEDRGRVEVVEASNQSTGYCPEPECWSVLEAVLDALKIAHPSALTAAFDFRRCDRCGATNLIKDEVFECAMCHATLSETWNYEQSD
jgi:hypothetical protein